MSLNLTLPPKPATAVASERDPAAYTFGFEAGVNAERAKWVEAGALKGNEPATAAKAKAEPEAVSWDAIAAEMNAKAGVSVPNRGA